MTNMPNAPLIYTLGVARFPRIPNVERFWDGFHDRIRKVYPVRDEHTLPVISATFGPEGLKMESHETHLVQFSLPDKMWAFLLTNEILVLHTIAYKDHLDFVSKFRFGLDALLKVPDIGVEWLDAVGIRYVDLVVPRQDERLSAYLRPWILPANAPNVTGGLSIREGMYVATYETSVGELRFQALRNPPTTLPPELDTPVIDRNGWKRAVPLGDFALLDADHGYTFDPRVRMDVDTVCDTLMELRAVVKEVFLASGTEYAIRVWEGAT